MTTLHIPDQTFTLDAQGIGRIRFEVAPEVVEAEVLPETQPDLEVKDAEVLPEVPVTPIE